MIKQIAAIGALASLGLATSSHAEKPGTVRYHKLGPLQNGAFGSGYKDRSKGPDTWRVIGKTGGSDYIEKARERIALYRAAELTESAGRKYIKFIKTKSADLTTGLFYGTWSNGTEFKLDFQATDTPDPEFHCASDVLRSECKTIDAVAAKNEIRPFLDFGK
ncbi:hypothetical protein ACFSUK_13705 [Sphingobium scionense]|uniref:Uncharacterized protein n=1 Tax=Sphingobium scionense TaxID=1404341 RepID=A0A7W6LTR6_9SPHN|nr:hypothetical protein [Sphingobium scionense]MBB4150348.1 hypothetical protein [Sphingobium scionense]